MRKRVAPCHSKWHFTLDVGLTGTLESVALGDLLLNFISHVQFQVIQNIENGLFERHMKYKVSNYP